MRKILLPIVSLLFLFSTAQDQPSVEKSIFGVQTGIFGLWIHNEAKLTNSIALRSEVGMDLGFSVSYSSITDKTTTLFAGTSVVSVQPKWYYNLGKREEKGKRIDGNSGNFISLNIRYHPDFLTFTTKDNYHVIPDLSVVPTWGIRRNIGEHFNYETFIGIGYQYLFRKDVGYLENESRAAVNLGFKIGYKF